MKRGSKILGLLLITALVTAALPAGSLEVAAADHESAPSAALGERPAGCHVHGGKSPSHSPLPYPPLPAPVSYKCCLTGHDAAVVPASPSLRPPVQYQWTGVTLPIESALEAYFSRGLEVLMVLSAGPPGTTPLRV